MALSIKKTEAERLARLLAQETGESITQAKILSGEAGSCSASACIYLRAEITREGAA
jgi:hypothetical protein